MNGDQHPPGATSISPFASSLSSSRASPFSPASSSTPTSTAATKNAMATSAFLPQSQPFRPSMTSMTSMTSQASYPLSIPAAHSFDRDATKAVGTPYSATPSTTSSILIRRLPLNTSEESLRLMTVFSKELLDVDLLAPEQSEDAGFRSAILNFETPHGAQEAKNMLDGKSNISNDAKMIVEVLNGSPISGRRYISDAAAAAAALSTNPSTTASSAASSVTSSRATSRFTGTFSSLDKISPPLNGVYVNGGSADLANSEPSAHFQTIFSPQSPIGNHLTDGGTRPRISGKSLINNDAADDDETGELLKDPVAYAENGAISAQQRRATAPSGLPIQQRMGALSLNTNPAGGPASMPPYGHQGMGPMSAAAAAHTMSPAAMSGTFGGGPGGGGGGGGGGNQHYRHHNFPPVNPADQNPPCNTLYVGNLPIDTSEEELKAMFSKQRGYKRLCFRTKQNGPMCFVEFEDVSFATKALHDLYGHMLHNSVKGGIRLSFSKNPLGVRSGQTPGQNNSGNMGSMNNGAIPSSLGGFASASGPPPGLGAPPGLGMSRGGGGGGGHYGSPSPANGAGNNNHNHYSSPAFGGSSSNGWGGSSLYHNMATGGPTSTMMATANAGYPSFMMGK